MARGGGGPMGDVEWIMKLVADLADDDLIEMCIRRLEHSAYTRGWMDREKRDWRAEHDAAVDEADRLDRLRDVPPPVDGWEAELSAEKRSDARLGDDRMRNGMQFAYGSNRRFP